MTDRPNPEALDQQALEAAAKALNPGLYGDFEESLVKHAGFSEEKASQYVEAKKRRHEELAYAAVSAYLAALPASRTFTNPLTAPHRTTTGAVSDVGNMGVPTPDTAPRAIETVEEIPATIQVISWEEEPEHECWKLSPDETFVGLIVKSGRSWSPADQYTLRVERTPTEGGGGMITILELLEAHRLGWVADDAGHYKCSCGFYPDPFDGTDVTSDDQHRAHVAGVLEAHQQEREAKAKAEALEEAASDSQMGPVAHGWNASGIASWLRARARAEQIRETS